jgi:hypothetical protein
MYCLDDGTPLVNNTNIPLSERPTIEFSRKPTFENPPETNAQITPPVWSPNTSEPIATNWTNAQPMPYDQWNQYPTPYGQGVGYGVIPPSKSLAIASLIIGIFSVISSIVCIGILTGPIAIVLGSMALVKIQNEPSRYGGSGMAITGIVTGSIPILIFLLIAMISN